MKAENRKKYTQYTTNGFVLRFKCTKLNFGCYSVPYLNVEAYSTPQTV